jgi:hypothetical protein
MPNGEYGLNLIFLLLNRLGGCMPLVVTYFSEFIQEKRRRLAITILFLWWPLGAAYVVMISWFILPSTGKLKKVY